MRSREVRYHATFSRDLRHLSKKHRGLQETVDHFLEQCATTNNQTLGDRIPGLDGAPVFKKRLAVGGRGARAGVRVIYYFDEHCVVALFVYAKNEKAGVPVPEIRAALAAADLLGSV